MWEGSSAGEGFGETAQEAKGEPERKPRLRVMSRKRIDGRKGGARSQRRHRGEVNLPAGRFEEGRAQVLGHFRLARFPEAGVGGGAPRAPGIGRDWRGRG